jgi:SAM-dependent methyltransferase
MLLARQRMPAEYTYARYLSSKRSVDDRALNKDVVRQLEIAVKERAQLNVLELGAGLGTMLARLVDWGVIRHASYTLLDVEARLLDDARDWLAEWATSKGFEVKVDAGDLRIRREQEVDLEVSFSCAELGHYLEGNPSMQPVDLLIANAFLDLVDVPTLLPHMLRLLAPGGLYWFTINYDGETIFQPAHEHDQQFMRVYNRSMDERLRFGRAAGSSRTGRLLFGALAKSGASVSAAGASDWIAYGQGGRYEADEAYFLHHIIYTIDEELKRHAEIAAGALADWVALRHKQIECGELLYIAHQVDLFGRREPSVQTTT